VSEILNEGRPVVVSSDRNRIGTGAWARLFATAVVPDEGSSTAELGRALARGGNVHTVSVAEGTLAADVATGISGDHHVTISAEPVSPRVWSAISRFARGNRVLEAGVEGREQSVHLEHLMTEDWNEPLIPRTQALRSTCTCGVRACEHVAALAYVMANEIDRDPSLLLRWRGCSEERAEAESAPDPVPAAPEAAAVNEPPGDPWLAGPLPTLPPARPFPVGAVMKRLGPSGLRLRGNDLAEVLERAYASFAGSQTD
jgi:uncharacterized Zn finger protein